MNIWIEDIKVKKAKKEHGSRCRPLHPFLSFFFFKITFIFIWFLPLEVDCGVKSFYSEENIWSHDCVMELYPMQVFDLLNLIELLHKYYNKLNVVVNKLWGQTLVRVLTCETMIWCVFYEPLLHSHILLHFLR